MEKFLSMKAIDTILYYVSMLRSIIKPYYRIIVISRGVYYYYYYYLLFIYK